MFTVTDFRLACRQLAKDPGFTAVAVITLALGMGANTTFFSVLHGVVLKSPPYPEAHRLVELRNRFANDPKSEARLSVPELFDYRERQRSLVGIGASISGRATLASDQGAERVQLTRVTANVLPLLGVPVARGRGFTENEEREGADLVVVVSHDFWQSQLAGAGEVLGRALRLNGVDHTIIGVMPPGFSYPEPGISVWKPLVLGARGQAERGDRSLRALARLAPGVSLAAASSDFRALSQRLSQELPAASPAEARPVVQVDSLRVSQFGHLSAPMGLLATAAAAVLLIACVNVAIMFLLRSAARRHEMMLRLALGAARGHIFRQLLAECSVVSALGTLTGLLLAGGGLALLKAFSPEQIPRLAEIGLNGPVIAFTGAVLALVTLAVGLAPAVSAFNVGAQDAALRSIRTTDGVAARRWRDGLTVVEIALAVTLLVGAGLTLRSFVGLLHVDLGFSPGRLYAFKTNLTPQGHPDAASANQFYTALLGKIAAEPGVTSVSAVSYLPLSGESQNITITPTSGSDSLSASADETPVGWRAVRGPYFESMKIALLGGRYFEAGDHATAPLVTIVDDALARRLWKTERAALGQQLRVNQGTNSVTRTVVGVVRSVKHFGPGQESRPEAYVPSAQVYQRGMYTVVQSERSPAELAARIRTLLAEVDTSVPMYFAGTVEERHTAVLTVPRFVAGLVTAFSVLALVLAGVGVFGVTAYAVGQRAREFGIRFSLGAQRSHVATLVLRRLAGQAGLGSAIGVIVALGTSRWLSGLLFGVAPTDPTTLAMTVAAMGLTVLAASVVPLARALRVSPVEALRAE